MLFILLIYIIYWWFILPVSFNMYNTFLWSLKSEENLNDWSISYKLHRDKIR